MNHKKYLFIALGLFLILSQFAVFGTSREYWFDPSFSVETVHLLDQHATTMDFREIDVHPPGYYYALYGWSLLNPSLPEYVWAQQLSILFGLAFILFVFGSLTLLFGKKGAIATVFFAGLPTYIHYATEPRGYIMVMMLSAGIFYFAVNQNNKNVLLMSYAILASVLLTFVHYLAGMAIPLLMIAAFVLSENKGFQRIWKSLLIGVSGLAGLFLALIWAVPQYMRSEGTWFVASDISSFPSALAYAFLVVESAASHTPFTAMIYSAFVLVVVGVGIAGIALLYTSTTLSKQQKAFLIMGSSALFPLMALIFVTFTTTGLASNLYHHRFFLVVTWMFAATVIVYITYVVSSIKYSILKWMCVLLGVLLLIGLNYVYIDSAHYELQNMRIETPCSSELIHIGHESAFSYMPYQVWAREHNCNWNNFISTRMTVGMSHTAGFDIVPRENIYWNGTIPNYGFYYVQSNERTFNLSGRQSEVIAVDDGIRLVKVEPLRSVVEISFQ